MKRPAAKPATTTTTTLSGKPGITTRSGHQLKGRPIPTMAVKTSGDESAVGPANAAPPPSPPSPPPEIVVCAEGVREPAGDASPAAHPEVLLCRTQSELDDLLRRSKEKIEYLKKSLGYLSAGSNKPMKEKPLPEGPQSCPASLQKGAEQIKKLVESAVSNGDGNSETLSECDEEDEPQKTSYQTQYIRYVVKIEPTNKSGKKGQAAATVGLSSGPKEGTMEEEEGVARESEAALMEEQLPSLHDSIMSHTASMAVGQNGLLDEKDKMIRDLKKQLVMARQKEKLKTAKHKERQMVAKQKDKVKAEQLQHLQEVIELLKERCPEYSSQRELARHCSLCHAPLLQRCHRVARRWAVVEEDHVSLPLSLPGPAERHHPVPPQQQRQARAGRSLKSQLCPWLSSGSLPLCPDCQSLGNRCRLKGRSSAVHCLRPTS